MRMSSQENRLSGQFHHEYHFRGFQLMGPSLQRFLPRNVGQRQAWLRRVHPDLEG